MTREEILGVSFYPDEAASGIKCVSEKDAFEAMDEYAKQMAMEFEKFSRNNFQPFMGGDVYIKSLTAEELKELKEWPDLETAQKFTREYIYHLFEEHLKQQEK